jgi:hypothetical protein
VVPQFEWLFANVFKIKIFLHLASPRESKDWPKLNAAVKVADYLAVTSHNIQLFKLHFVNLQRHLLKQL